jgi:hypothetical protein
MLARLTRHGSPYRALNSRWCQRERIFALQEGKTVIPVKIEDVKVPIEIVELDVPEDVPRRRKGAASDHVENGSGGAQR